MRLLASSDTAPSSRSSRTVGCLRRYRRSWRFSSVVASRVGRLTMSAGVVSLTAAHTVGRWAVDSTPETRDSSGSAASAALCEESGAEEGDAPVGAEELGGPGPVRRQPQDDPSGTAHDAAGDVQEAVAQGLGLGPQRLVSPMCSCPTRTAPITSLVGCPSRLQRAISTPAVGDAVGPSKGLRSAAVVTGL